MTWSNRQIGYLKRWYGRRTSAQIAESLGTTSSAVHQAASRLGLSKPRLKKDLGDVRKRIRELHAIGYCDTEIAADVGCSREWIGEIRRKLGLPSNANNERHRARVRANTAQQCRKAGMADELTGSETR